MHDNRPTSDLPAASSPRRLLRIDSVWATPGGWVHVLELTDGWAVFTNTGARYRRWQGICGLALVAVLVAEWLLQHGAGPAAAEGVLGLAAFGLVALIVSLGQVALQRAGATRRQGRVDSLRRAGGRNMQRQALRHAGRARTVGEMNILLSSLGRTEPVYSRTRAHKVAIDRRWWRTTVRIDLTGGHHIVYRVRGIRKPTTLARVFAQPDSAPQAG